MTVLNIASLTGKNTDTGRVSWKSSSWGMGRKKTWNVPVAPKPRPPPLSPNKSLFSLVWTSPWGIDFWLCSITWILGRFLLLICTVLVLIPVLSLHQPNQEASLYISKISHDMWIAGGAIQLFLKIIVVENVGPEKIQFSSIYSTIFYSQNQGLLLG